ncbi:hypothetical protein BH11ARM1_BH11ARM1_08970 [soil metagenome]
MASRRIANTKRVFEGERALTGLITIGICFIAIGILVRYSLFQNVDLKVTKELQEEYSPVTQVSMKVLTFIGEPFVLPIFGFAAAWGLKRVGLPRASKFVLLSLIAIPINVVLKLIWDTARPDAALVQVAVKTAGTSFPSGHAMGSTALYGAFAALAWIHLDARKTRLPLVLVLIALPFGIGYSRIYLGAHWLSDVLGGTSMGMVVLIPLLRWYLRCIPDEEEIQAAKKAAALQLKNDPTLMKGLP